VAGQAVGAVASAGSPDNEELVRARLSGLGYIG
jgi:hypothetical protein